MRKRNDRWMLGLLVAAALPLASVPALAGGKSIGKASGVVPATVEHTSGSDLGRVTLTERAIERIDLQTTKVAQAMNGSGRTVVPYSAIIYDPKGGTWVYTSPKERTFVRHEIQVVAIEGDKVFLKSGPPVGTPIASVGVAELYGAEFAVGH